MSALNRPIVLIVGMSVCLSLIGRPAVAQDQVTVVGLSLTQKDPDNEYGQSFVPGASPGTQVYLRAVLSGKTILKIDDEKTQISIRDSTGAELSSDEQSNFGFFASIAEDRHSVVVPIQSEDLPGSGADGLTIRGTITCNCGADPKTETVDVELTADGEIKLGSLTAKVVQIEEGFEPDSQRIELESKTSFDQLESLVFLGDGGKEIETSDSGSGSFGFGGETTYSRSFQLSASADKVRAAKITYFQKVDSVAVSVDAHVGLDLSGK